MVPVSKKSNAFAVLKEESRILRRKEKLEKKVQEELRRREKYQQPNDGRALWAEISDDDDCFYDEAERKPVKTRPSANPGANPGGNDEPQLCDSDGPSTASEDEAEEETAEGGGDAVTFAAPAKTKPAPSCDDVTAADLNNMTKKERQELKKKEMSELEAMLSEFGVQESTESEVPAPVLPVQEGDDVNTLTEASAIASIKKKKKKKLTNPSGDADVEVEEAESPITQAECCVDRDSALAKARQRIRRPKTVGGDEAIRVAAEEAKKKQALKEKKEKKEKMYFPQR